ncbi:hypothetical protein CFE70_000430 [Pyrenophora teres f. teres 0-1]
MADSHSATTSSKARTSSISQASESSQTAADFIKEQLSLEKEAREALPYVSTFAIPLYACLTCNPAPASSAQQYTPAGVCYSCSISCHGEHTLVELFKTGRKGDVTGEEPAKTNEYNQNFRNKFCGCSQEYDPDQEKGTMFQCLGLGSCNGGCGEDWWHPECLVGFTREEFSKMIEKPKTNDTDGVKDAMDIDKSTTEETKAEEKLEEIVPPGQTSIAAAVGNGNGVDGNDIATDGAEEEEDEDPPLPPGFPGEEDFDHFICYKCVAANPWIKKYAGSTGFLPPIYHSAAWAVEQAAKPTTSDPEPTTSDSKKRKATDEAETQQTSSTLVAPVPAKRQKSEDPSGTLTSIPETPTATRNQLEETPEAPKHTTLPPLPHKPTQPPSPSSSNPLSAPTSATATPPVSASGDDNNDPEGAQSVGTGSILDRGEAAFNNMDRVRAIQGAMAYAHLKDKVAAFLKPFAESGTPVGAEDVKAYFEKLRGDEKGIAEAKGVRGGRGVVLVVGKMGKGAEGRSRVGIEL